MMIVVLVSTTLSDAMFFSASPYASLPVPDANLPRVVHSAETTKIRDAIDMSLTNIIIRLDAHDLVNNGKLFSCTAEMAL